MIVSAAKHPELSRAIACGENLTQSVDAATYVGCENTVVGRFVQEITDGVTGRKHARDVGSLSNLIHVSQAELTETDNKGIRLDHHAVSFRYSEITTRAKGVRRVPNRLSVFEYAHDRRLRLSRTTDADAT